MNCPKCGTKDYYQGMFKGSCLNNSCSDFDPTSSSVQQPSIAPLPPTKFKPYFPPLVQAVPPIPCGILLQPQTWTIQQEMDIASEFLLFVRQSKPEAVIAGGAPRNWHYGMNANDIDVFVESNGNWATYPAITNVLPISSANKYPPGFIDFIQNLEFKGMKFQVIWYKDVPQTVGHLNPSSRWPNDIQSSSLMTMIEETFDFGICKIFFVYNIKTGICEMVSSKHFKDDHALLQMSVDMNRMKQYNRWPTFLARAEKMRQYFPNRKIVIY